MLEFFADFQDSQNTLCMSPGRVHAEPLHWSESDRTLEGPSLSRFLPPDTPLGRYKERGQKERGLGASISGGLGDIVNWFRLFGFKINQFWDSYIHDGLIPTVVSVYLFWLTGS